MSVFFHHRPLFLFFVVSLSETSFTSIPVKNSGAWISFLQQVLMDQEKIGKKFDLGFYTKSKVYYKSTREGNQGRSLGAHQIIWVPNPTTRCSRFES